MERTYLEEFEKIVGKEFVSVQEREIRLAETTNYHTTQTIHAIIHPANATELTDCVRIAGEYNIPVHTVSKGKNWGYGSRVPVADNSVLVDISRLNAITDYNEKLAYVTIEPGVTFQQLYDFLRGKGSELIISTTGGGPESSVLANALERGIGTGLYAERFAHVCGMEVLLADGNVIATGMARFGDVSTANLYKWGMGPSLDGIFSQSNFGIVTKATVWLMSCPEYFRLLFYKITDDNKLADLVDTLQQLAMNGAIRPAITMYNDFRTISTMVQYPWQHCSPDRSGANDVLETLRKNIPATSIASKWNGELSIRALNKEHADVQTRIIEDGIKDKVDELTVVEVTREEIVEIWKQHYETKNIPHDVDIIKSFLVRKYIGIPDGTAVRQAYWRKKTSFPKILDPDRDKCGLIWVCPVIPFTGKDAIHAVNIINTIIEKYRLEPAISLQCLSERAINIIVSFVWDREIDGEDANAEECYKELNQVLKDAGYYPYRNTTKGMEHKVNDEEHDNYLTLLSKIKKAIDPQNILSPGRYNVNG